MVRNVRWLYSKLGTEDFSATGQSTVTGALSSLKSDLDGKSNSSHTHSTGTLPVSSNQVNSGSYIPTSALLYSMAQRVEGIQSIVSLAKRELDDPNKRYESKNLGTWSSASDVDTFLNQYTHENNYGDLALGNYITISDNDANTADVSWEIAGFDMECCQTAADGTVYDNGYGICLIPKTTCMSSTWNSTAITGGYISSNMHNKYLPGIVTTLKNVLGNHIVNRNVLLSSSIDSSTGKSNAYTWTSSYATLMSVGQMNGTFASHNNKYDDGEANYKLPLFNYEEFKTGSVLWTRNIRGTSQVWAVSISGSFSSGDCSALFADSRPLIYIR